MSSAIRHQTLGKMISLLKILLLPIKWWSWRVDFFFSFLIQTNRISIIQLVFLKKRQEKLFLFWWNAELFVFPPFSSFVFFFSYQICPQNKKKTSKQNVSKQNITIFFYFLNDLMNNTHKNFVCIQSWSVEMKHSMFVCVFHFCAIFRFHCRLFYQHRRIFFSFSSLFCLWI